MIAAAALVLSALNTALIISAIVLHDTPEARCPTCGR